MYGRDGVDRVTLAYMGVFDSVQANINARHLVGQPLKQAVTETVRAFRPMEMDLGPSRFETLLAEVRRYAVSYAERTFPDWSNDELA